MSISVMRYFFRILSTTVYLDVILVFGCLVPHLWKLNRMGDFIVRVVWLLLYILLLGLLVIIRYN